MPQATDALRKVMIDRFGSIDAGAPLAYLKERGWTVTDGGEIIEPKGTPWAKLPSFERQCCMFLIEEWDYA